MINRITQASNLLKSAKTWYEERNKAQAVNMLYDGRQRYLAGIFNGFNTFLDHFTKYSSVIAAVLSVSALLGLSMTPIGWSVVGAAMLVGGVALAVYSVHDYLKKSKKITHDLETKALHESQIENLEEEIKAQYTHHDVLQAELERLAQSAEALGVSVDSQTQATLAIETQPVANAAQESEEKNRFKRALKDIAAHVSNFFIKLGQLLKLPELTKFIETKFPKFTDAVKSLIGLILPIQKKIKEFTGILTFVTAAFSGFFVGIASIMGVSIAKQTFLQSFVALLGSVSPIGIAIMCGAVLLTSASLLINKIFFQDPQAELTKNLEQEKKELIENLNQNQLLFDVIDNKNKALQEKINLLAIKINLKSTDQLKEGEFKARHEFESEETDGRLTMLSTFFKETPQSKPVEKAPERLEQISYFSSSDTIHSSTYDQEQDESPHLRSGLFGNNAQSMETQQVYMDGLSN